MFPSDFLGAVHIQHMPQHTDSLEPEVTDGMYIYTLTFEARL